MTKSKQVEDLALYISERLNGEQLPKMYHPTEDLISIPLIVDGKKLVVDIRSVVRKVV